MSFKEAYLSTYLLTLNNTEWIKSCTINQLEVLGNPDYNQSYRLPVKYF
jgi:hypothetical protein